MNVFTADEQADPGFWGRVLDGLTVFGGKAISVLITIVICVLVGLLLRLVIRRVVNRIVHKAKSKAQVTDTVALERSPLADMRLVQRTRTLGSILQNIVSVALAVIALVVIVRILDSELVGSLSLITAAVGAGLGFGAQNIVKDVLNGMFIVAEDQIGIGDVVDIGLASGVVEAVSVRITQVRDVNGTLWHVRNGEILRIGNMSQGWARVILDVGAPMDADLDEVEELMSDAAMSITTDPKWRTRLTGSPEIWGLEAITGEAIVVRIVLKTRANAKDDVGQELRKRIKKAFDEKGLEMPSLAGAMPVGLDGARRVRGANPPKTKPNPITGTPKPARGIWRYKKDPNSRNPDAEGDQK